MASRVFLDANVLLDLTLEREHHAVAREVMTLVISGRVQGYVTPSVIHTIGYFLEKAFGTTKAREILVALLNDLISIDITHEEVLAALHSSIRDTEDALQYYAALNYRIDYFISRDKQLKKEAMSALPVYTPEEFLKETRANKK
ncbi:MAG TPA: PIN domain-containing protein [Dinghuibacter sp.]|uniref:type II toxin-antitoxin system VapC family toxin n=1 Tax=Dinghuibacter sp. TaxID=2024697 RepID=UPI002BA30105|nr:PIN domain-containing protein [Dinghuibacter sp.]HTJ14675.1 PIN domain-containing protein [Dinghuibacter sp.]